MIVEADGVARAVVVGVSNSSFAPDSFPPLPDARLDAEGIASLLEGRGFKIDLHIDGPSTRRASVADALASVVAETRAGDLSVIYLAGHGFQIRNEAGFDDGWDEAFVCGDGAILDDWFRDQLWPTARDGARFVVVVDACHSGTITLGLRAGEEDRPAVAPLVQNRFYRLTLSACRDEEDALAVAKQDKGGGVVTCALLDTLRVHPDQSYRNVWSAVAGLVRDRYVAQDIGTPQLDSYGPDFSLEWSKAFVWPLDR